MVYMAANDMVYMAANDMVYMAVGRVGVCVGWGGESRAGYLMHAQAGAGAEEGVEE